MKTILVSLKMLTVLGAFIISFNACQKESVMPATTNTTNNNVADHISEASYNMTTANEYAYDITNMVSEAYYMEGLTGSASKNNASSRIGACATVTVKESGFPKTMTIDFGPTGCKGSDGKIRRGMIMITMTGPYEQEGTMINVTTHDFYLNNDRIDANIAMTNIGRSGDQYNRITFNQQVHATIVKDNAKSSLTIPGPSLTFSADRRLIWIAGDFTADVKDDIYEVRGEGNITDEYGVAFHSKTIPDKDLRKDVAWPYYVWGVEEISRTAPDEVAFKVKVDYSYPTEGNYDNQAMVFYENGKSELITLK